MSRYPEEAVCSAAAEVENRLSMVTVVGRSAGSHRATVLVEEPQRDDGDGGCGCRGWVHYKTLRPSCMPGAEMCWRVRLVECSGESMFPGSWGGGLQVPRGSGGPHHLRKIRDEAELVPAGTLGLLPGTDRAPLKELLCLQNTERTADRRSCLVRMGTATQEDTAWRLKKNKTSPQH
jgi:hypothetical protein